jgi:integrase
MAVLKSIPRDSACPYIFPTRLIGVYNPWDRIRRRAGLADVRLHDLRHSFASLLVNQGVSLYVVQDAAETVSSVICDSRAGNSGITGARQAEPRP